MKAAHDGKVVEQVGGSTARSVGSATSSRTLHRLDRKHLWQTLPITVVIDDGNGYRSIYAHFSKIVVKKGQTVKAGQLLGLEGRHGPSIRLPRPLWALQPARDGHLRYRARRREAHEGAGLPDRPRRPAPGPPAARPEEEEPDPGIGTCLSSRATDSGGSGRSRAIHDELTIRRVAPASGRGGGAGRWLGRRVSPQRHDATDWGRSVERQRRRYRRPTSQ